ncbi:MAG: DUF4097 family beta strand repeat protein [Clostridia bacterium]|nr:DUF4097 family beta strand repeat protein [Clostridia bacterium]
MSNEKMKILEMIEKKIITAEEGLKLLNAVDDQNNVPESVKVEEEMPLNEEELEEAVEEAVEELEDLVEEIEEEVEDLMDELDETFEEATEDLHIEEELEEQLKEKVEQIKEKANILKEKFMKEFDFDGDELKINFSKNKFKNDMNNWKNSFDFEMKSLNKEARQFGKEMSRLGKETAQITKDIVSDVMNNLNLDNLENITKEFSEKDFIMDEDKAVKNYNLAQEFSLNIDGKTDISIQVVSTDVTIVTEDREDLLVNYIKYNPKDEDLFQVVVEEDSKKLRISEKQKVKQNIFNFGSSAKKLLIRLPHKYKESISINTVSGDLDLNYLDSDFFKFSSVSGDMSADIIYSVNSLVKTTSGDCNIDLFRGNMMFSTVSGDIKLTYEVLDGDFSMKSVSGDAEIKLPKNAEFEVIAKTLSGDLNCEFPITFVGAKKRGRLRGQVGSDAHSITATTTSGDLNIGKY